MLVFVDGVCFGAGRDDLSLCFSATAGLFRAGRQNTSRGSGSGIGVQARASSVFEQFDAPVLSAGSLVQRPADS